MTNLVFGGLLVIVGISYIIKAVFGINIPLFQVFFGLLIIYWGLTVLTGQTLIKYTCHSTYTKNGKYYSDTGQSRKHSMAFAEGTIDLTDIKLNDKPITIEVSAAFAACTILINRTIPTVFSTKTLFGTIDLPPSNAYTSPEPDQEPQLELCINTTLGTTKVEVV